MPDERVPAQDAEHEHKRFYYYMSFHWKLTPGPLGLTKPQEGVRHMEIGRDKPICRFKDLLGPIQVCFQQLTAEIKPAPGDNFGIEVMSWQRFESMRDEIELAHKIPDKGQRFVA